MDADRAEAIALEEVLARVRACTGLDFSCYREPTMRRRVRNRMIALGLRTVRQYLEVLAREPAEARHLVERLTIKVSRFYRNPAVFDLLRERVLPALAQARGGAPLRLWSAGCGRGEEPYTLAMLLDTLEIPGRVLATDIDPFALEAASEGVYAHEATLELPAAMRDRFLQADDEGTRWRVTPALRQRVEFCRHDLLGPLQPREGSFDAVACRNLVIYLQRAMHERAMVNLRRALAADGVLVLGEAEWPAAAIEASLEPVAARLRVFRAGAMEAIAA